MRDIEQRFVDGGMNIIKKNLAERRKLGLRAATGAAETVLTLMEERP